MAALMVRECVCMILKWLDADLCHEALWVAERLEKRHRNVARLALSLPAVL